VKTKILITSILLAVIGTILAGYLVVGCSSDQGGISRRAKEKPYDSLGLSDGRQPADAESQRKPTQTMALEPGGPKSNFSESRNELDKLEFLGDKPLVGGLYRRTDPDTVANMPAEIPDRSLGGARGGRGIRANDSLSGTLPADAKLGWRAGRSKQDYSVSLGTVLSESRRSRTSTPNIYSELATVTADEIWIIAKAETGRIVADEDTPGSGAMLVKMPEEEKEIPLPLKHTDVKGQISGYIATVEAPMESVPLHRAKREFPARKPKCSTSNPGSEADTISPLQSISMPA